MSGQRLRKAWIPALIFAPCVLFYLFLFLLPQGYLLGSSFVSDGHLSAVHYTRFLTDSYNWMLLGRTLWLGVCVTLVCLFFGVPLAYVLARSESRWADLWIMLTTLPLLVNVVVRSFGWMVLFLRNGLLSQLLHGLHITDARYQLIYTFTGVVIALGQVLLPLVVLILVNVFRSIDRDIERAAMSLGACPPLAICITTLSIAKNGIAAASLLVFSLAISSFATPSLIGGARANVMVTAIYDEMTQLLDWPYASAMATVLLVIVLGISLAYGRALQGPRNVSRRRP